MIGILSGNHSLFQDLQQPSWAISRYPTDHFLGKELESSSDVFWIDQQQIRLGICPNMGGILSVLCVIFMGKQDDKPLGSACP